MSCTWFLRLFLFLVLEQQFISMTIPGIYGVEKVGRRNLLLYGAAGMCICEYIVAIVGVTISVDNVTGQKVLIAFVCIYIVSNAI